MLALGCLARGDLGLRGCEGGKEACAVGEIGVALRCYRRQCGAGVGEFDGFTGEEGGMGCALGGEDGEGVGF